MSGRPFRFIHASDLHIDRLPRGLAQPPEHLRELLVEAPLVAAQRVFDAVLAEEADFLVLAGDVINPTQAGPRGLVFLLDQFQRLLDRGIGVYWAGGPADRPDAWPTALKLPENVRVFPQGRVEEFVARRDGLPLARLLGTSHDGRPRIRAADFPAEHTQVYSIGVAHGSAEPERLAHRAIHFWALGGRHQRTTPSSGPHIVHYAGASLGRSFRDVGVHGCTLIQVDEQGRSRMALVPTDPLRWVHETLALPANATDDDLLNQLCERTAALVLAAPGVHLFISWTVSGGGAVATKLRRGGLAAELLATLRTQFGHGEPAAWTVSIEVEPAPLPAELYGEETILGDFLRAVRRHENHADVPLDLENYLSERQLAGTMQSAVRLDDAQQRRRILLEAALLGADFFTTEDVPS